MVGVGGPYSINPQSGSRIGGQGQIWQRGGQVRTVLLMDFPIEMYCLCIFYRENVENCNYTLWWAGLAQKYGGRQVRGLYDRGLSLRINKFLLQLSFELALA